jgi:hypothetical protein
MPNTDEAVVRRAGRVQNRIPSKILNESFYAELNNIDDTVAGGAHYYPSMHKNIKNKI